MKIRLDKLLHEKNITDSREKAKALIMAGKILVNKEKIDKPGTLVIEESEIQILGEKLPYVSRGGLKLEKALKSFPLSVENKVILDIGASTGGFTDCALQNGAKKVYAVDVGYGQLDWKLRSNEKVVSMERTNARYLEKDSFQDQIDFVTTDVAFISLTKILPAIKRVLKPDGGESVVLIKPQFEAGREKVGKKGVVKDPRVHLEVINNILNFSKEEGFIIKGLTFSPIKGPEGNIEYLLWLGLSETEIQHQNIDADAVVREVFSGDSFD
jgi:23S rRNA (cytidine1920-2'-O)/16S rRNA (cytidine1409-2'-O)-methyltransferase